MELVIILLLIILNGIFAMSEMALVSSKKFKLESAKKKGSSGAKKALELAETPTRFLSTVQIGITLIGILLGVFSGKNLSDNVVQLINKVDFLAPYAQSIATVVVVLLITYLSIVLGELLPKRLGMTFPEPIISLFAKPMYYLSILTSPFVWILTMSNNMLLSVLGINSMSNSTVSEEEIKAMVKESAEGGEIEGIEHEIVERVFELGDRKVNSLYTHRTDLVYFNTSDTWETVVTTINEEKHSVYPVVENHKLDEIIGIVKLKDLFNVYSDSSNFDINNYLIKPIYVTENTSAYKILEMFKNEKMHYAIVVNEYGTTVGIVTMDDVLDALVGDSTEHGQEEYQIVQRDENSWLVDGQYPLVEFVKTFELDIDDFLLEKYSTIAGLVIHHLSSVPNVGERCTIEGYIFEIVDKDGQRIDKLMVSVAE
ncbi:MAG TPA: hemolysin family protein [Chitinophagales bacterium]|nr:hemolysin family protein [Chitinophagales bacterium]HMU99353.1 hemolysin family protein [Chitinophagales bacterium]HMV03842.1 hemolysin family protein [Chitinophagales bacterium]HMW95507.1 hemolysin family protein [Chitinophagales bacterium]HMZ69751.1 hemolysin family protein [Chitinophagales bacterium]